VKVKKEKHREVEWERTGTWTRGASRKREEDTPNGLVKEGWERVKGKVIKPRSCNTSTCRMATPGGKGRGEKKVDLKKNHDPGVQGTMMG